LTMLCLVASCSSGHATVRAPATTAPALVTITVPGSRPLPTVVRAAPKPSSCPGQMPTSLPQHGVARLDISLVAVAAVAVEVCTYAGPGAPRALRSHVAFAGPTATTIADALNGVAGIDPVSGPRCDPGPDASVLVAVSDGLRVEEFRVSLTGCRGVSNGLLSGAGTASTARVLGRAIALADTCVRRFGLSAGCIAGSS
jgi:hypothetical protein